MTKWLVLLTKNGARALDRTPPISAEGLLCALVLAPSTFPRNRFISLYLHPDAKRARSRAAQLRTIARHLAGRTKVKVELSSFEEHAEGGHSAIGYRIAEIKLERRAWLDRLELALVRVAIDRIAHLSDPTARERMARLGAASDSRLAPTEDDRRAIEGALSDWGRCITGPAEPVDGPLGA